MEKLERRIGQDRAFQKQTQHANTLFKIKEKMNFTIIYFIFIQNLNFQQI